MLIDVVACLRKALRADARAYAGADAGADVGVAAGWPPLSRGWRFVTA